MPVNRIAALPLTSAVASPIITVNCVMLRRANQAIDTSRCCHHTHTSRPSTTSHTRSPIGPASVCSAGQ